MSETTGIAAVIAVLSAVVSGALALWNTRALQRRQERLGVDAVFRRYRDPLLRSATDLQGRIFNIVAQGFMNYYRFGTPFEQTYALDHTAYLVADYFGWVEILRTEVQFLDAGDKTETAMIQRKLELIAQSFLTDNPNEGRLRLWRGQQRAIGELLMTLEGGDPRHRETLGYARFSKRLGDPEFAAWFDGLRTDIAALGDPTNLQATRRLVRIQNCLMDLIVVLDKGTGRVPVSDLRRLEDSDLTEC